MMSQLNDSVVIDDGKVIGKRDELSNAIVIRTPIPLDIINNENRKREDENQKITLKLLWRRVAKLESEILELKMKMKIDK